MKYLEYSILIEKLEAKLELFNENMLSIQADLTMALKNLKESEAKLSQSKGSVMKVVSLVDFLKIKVEIETCRRRKEMLDRQSSRLAADIISTSDEIDILSELREKSVCKILRIEDYGKR